MTEQEFQAYLEGAGRRDEVLGALRKLGFDPGFIVRNVLTGVPVTVSRVAMLWQGMPNKHDRKRTRQLFEILTGLGLLTPAGDDETWRPANIPAGGSVV